MGYIFYLMGKSSSGKDTIYKEIKSKCEMLKSINLYTTRPIREGEEDGVEYYFVDDNRCSELCESGKVIELRAYHTVYGVWKYFTVDDEQFNLEEESYLMIGTLESYQKMVEYFGKESMLPIYINVEDGVRLRRAMEREESQVSPKYAEMCRRFLADTEDFSQDKLKNANVEKEFVNDVFEECVEEIMLYINTKI